MKNKYLVLLSALVLASFFTITGCNNGKNPVPSTPDDTTTPIPQDSMPIDDESLQVESIKIANFDEEGVVASSAFTDVTDFNKANSGPYSVSKKMKTAHIALRIEKAKPTQGDFAVYVENANSYLPKAELVRGTGAYEAYFVNQTPANSRALPSVVLARGKNTILVTVSSVDKSKQITYKIVVEYKEPGLRQSKVLSGIFCPANKKLSEQDKKGGEKEELLWPIFFAGWCNNCPKVLNAAGKTENIAEKYEKQGLRVVAIDIESDDSKDDSYRKWNTSGKKYPCYTRKHNVLTMFYQGKYIPFAPCVKDGKLIMAKDSTGNEVPLQGDGHKNFEAFILEVFGLEKAK